MICYTKKLLFSVCLILSFSCLLAAQDNPAPNVALELSSDDDDNDKEDKKKKEEPAAKPVPSAIRPVKEKFSPAIADNSFLIEEAYNQEPGIVQHISTCMGFRKPQSNMACTFTQEWPVPNMKHQFSYTLPYSSLNANQFHGVGDVMLNYRYQWKGEDDWAAIAPRVSVILPTGNTNKDLGTGSAGLQFNLPVSKRVSEKFVTHFNAGFTLLPKVKGEDLNGNQFRRALSLYNVGGSVIWLTHQKFNVMFEYLSNFNSEFDAAGNTSRFKEQIVNPGFRFALDVGELQIVPGVSVPLSFSQGERRQGLFFYVSFEHPFSKKERK